MRIVSKPVLTCPYCITGCAQKGNIHICPSCGMQFVEIKHFSTLYQETVSNAERNGLDKLFAMFLALRQQKFLRIVDK